MSGSIDSRDDFRPTASIDHLRTRAGILARVRAFFRDRHVLEVDTPLICAAGAVDAHLEPIVARVRHADLGEPGTYYLVTSPEHSMKRLLAAGSGPIYQITRGFRDGERGRLHNPEFTILEWYRPGFDHVALMDEVEALVGCLLRDAGVAPDASTAPGAATTTSQSAADSVPPVRAFDRITYRDAFRRALGIDPFETPVAELEKMASDAAIDAGDAGGVEGAPGSESVRERDAGRDTASPTESERDAWLNVLLAARVEPTLGVERPTFVIDYPASQAALARVRPGPPPVAERFELYVRGIELANGYHELLDPAEQEDRFIEANVARRHAGKADLPLDRRFLAALRAGLPSCAGVAMGLDRIVMLAVGARSIDEVMTFPIERA